MVDDIRDTTTPADHIGLVKMFADIFVRMRPYVASHYDDLVSVGCVSLVDHWDGYDPEKGALSTYIRLHMLNAFTRYVVKEFYPVAVPYSGRGPIPSAKRVGLDDEDESGSSYHAVDNSLTNLCDVLSDKVLVSRAVKSLSEQDRILITERYGLFGECPKSLREMALDYHTTHQNIAYHIKKAVRSLRSAMLQLTSLDRYEAWYEKRKHQ